MSKVINLRNYMSGGDVFVAVDHIESFREICYNGNPGTEVTLKSGTKINVAEYPHIIQEKINKP